MYYKNVSCYPKTFHGVDFGPGETKEVKKFINDRSMILINSPKVEEKKQPSAPAVKEEMKEEPKKAPGEQKKPSEKAETTPSKKDTIKEESHGEHNHQ